MTQNVRIVAGIFFSILGSLAFLGALRKWKWVLNPEHPIAKYMGMDILRGFAFILGTTGIAIGLLYLYWAFF